MICLLYKDTINTAALPLTQVAFLLEIGSMSLLGNSSSKSLYISHAVSNFYGTGIEIWAGFGPVGNTEKKSWGPIMSNF